MSPPAYAVMQEKKCKVCKKRFCVPNTQYWAYKIKKTTGTHYWFCSWSCISKYHEKYDKPVKLKGGDDYAY